MTIAKILSGGSQPGGPIGSAPGPDAGRPLYVLHRLGPDEGPAFGELTFPAYRPFLHRLADDASVVAIGASRFGRPVGLALAQVHTYPAGSMAQLLSLSVREGYRRAGFGNDLLSALERQLQDRACQWVETTYLTDGPQMEGFERLLARRGWEPPTCRFVVHRATAATMESAPWLARHRLRPGYEAFPWRDLTPEDRRAILDRQSRQQWYEESLSPFFEEASMEHMNSLGLRHEGRVIGWIITHRTSPNTIRYTRLHLDYDPRFRGCSPALLAASINLHLAYVNLRGLRDRLEAVWAINPTNAPMMRFAERRLKPYLRSSAESRGTFKRLAPAVAAPAPEET